MSATPDAVSIEDSFTVTLREASEELSRSSKGQASRDFLATTTCLQKRDQARICGCDNAFSSCKNLRHGTVRPLVMDGCSSVRQLLLHGHAHDLVSRALSRFAHTSHQTLPVREAAWSAIDSVKA